MIRLTKEELKQATQKHFQNIQANIQRRLDAARAQGDEKLVKMLEAEGDSLRQRRGISKQGNV